MKRAVGIFAGLRAEIESGTRVSFAVMKQLAARFANSLLGFATGA